MNHAHKVVSVTLILVALAALGAWGGLVAVPLGRTTVADVMRGVGDSARERTPSFVTARDTINGLRIANPEIVDRIDRIAVRVPVAVLAGNRRGKHVWYLAHAFTAGDDASIEYGVFAEPAAALAFGCARDSDLADACEMVDDIPAHSPYEDPPGVRCVPMRIALGAPAYEPDRCETAG